MTNTLFTDARLLEEISKFTRTKFVKRDEVIMSPGDVIVFVPIVLHGVVRIVRQNDEGKEIFLYHLYPGQTCAMAINSCRQHTTSSIKAIAEEDTELMLVPSNLIEDWFRFPEWKNYINSNYGLRFAELVDVIDLVAFSNMDKQVLHYLRERGKASGSNLLEITHQEIADELHTRRESVSRLLRTMEQKHLLRLGRSTIELL